MTADLPSIETNLRLHVEKLAGLIGPRVLSKPKSIEATIGYIRNQWSQIGYSVNEEPFDALGDAATNLSVELKGGMHAEQTVLLGAHYDTVPTTPGADDNASAVAVLLEVSRRRLSDNSSFWDQRYPALMLTDTSFLRNPHYHLESDVPYTLDYAAMTQVTLGVAGAMRRLLQA